jgi:hypothetical protein
MQALAPVMPTRSPIARKLIPLSRSRGQLRHSRGARARLALMYDVSVDWDQAEWSGHSLTAPLSGNVDEYWRGAYEEAISRVLNEVGRGIYGCVLTEVQIVASGDPDAREVVTDTLTNVMASANANAHRKKRLYSDLG